MPPTTPGFSRRRFLTGLAGAGALLPFIPVLESEAAAGPTRRIIFFHTPNGLYRDSFMPAGSGTDFELPATLEPLAEFQQDLLVLEGLDNEAWFADPDRPPDHGFRLTMMTGTPTVFLGVGSNGKNINSIGGISIDQFIAEQLDAPVPFESLVLGVRANPINDRRKLWAKGAEDPVAVVDDPLQAHQMLFADSGIEPGELLKLRARRQSVIDVVLEDLDRVQGRVGSADASKIEAHLQGIREVEKRLQGVDCEPLDPQDVASYPDVGAAMIDMMAAAIRCDMTRVGVLNFGGPSSVQTFPWLDVNAEHHPLAHHSSTARDQAGWDDQQQLYEGITRVDQWHAEQLAALLGKLRAIEEDGGTALDNTVVVWCTDQGQTETGGHDRRNVPFVLCGGAGGYLSPGRVLRLGSRPANDLYVSLCHAMGLEHVDSFGLPSICNGPLTELVG